MDGLASHPWVVVTLLVASCNRNRVKLRSWHVGHLWSECKFTFTIFSTRCFFSSREVSNGYHVLEGRTELSLRDASRRIAYKYVVVRPQGKDLWECLIGFKPFVTDKHVNRCLSIPESSIKSNGKSVENRSLAISCDLL